MICPHQVFLAVAPLDLRWGLERLSCHVQQVLGRSPCDGSAYAFSNRTRTRLKLLVWDHSGIWLCQRRLHQALFCWPQPGEPVWRISEREWHWLVAGVAWRGVERG